MQVYSQLVQCYISGITGRQSVMLHEHITMQRSNSQRFWLSVGLANTSDRLCLAANTTYSYINRLFSIKDPTRKLTIKARAKEVRL